MSVQGTDKATIQGFVLGPAAPGTPVFTVDHGGYHGLPNHQSIKHSVGEYVDGMAHTNRIASSWAMLKRGYHRTFHRISPEQLDRCVNEFSGRHNIRNEDTAVQMTAIVQGMAGKRLKYRDLIASALKQPALSDVF